MAYTTEKKVCPRCRGKGFVGSPVVYAGAPGTCYSCTGAGEVYRDSFYRVFGVGRTFFGITTRRYLNRDNPNNGIFKSLSTDRDWKLGTGSGLTTPFNRDSIYSAIEISEDQARSFYARYKDRCLGAGVRVAEAAEVTSL